MWLLPPFALSPVHAASCATRVSSVKHLCKFGVAFSRGFAQVRLAFSVFIALGRAPTRGVRNDEVIILPTPRHKCVWVWVQCSACPVLWLRQRTFAQIRQIDSRDCPGGRRSFGVVPGFGGVGSRGFRALRAVPMCQRCLSRSIFKGPLLRGIQFSEACIRDAVVSCSPCAPGGAAALSRNAGARPGRAGLGNEE